MTTDNFTWLYTAYMATSQLSIAEKSKFWLIQKYKSKVSKRLLIEAEELYKKGHKLYIEKLSNALLAPNPLLKAIRADNWKGAILPVPLKLDKS